MYSPGYNPRKLHWFFKNLFYHARQAEIGWCSLGWLLSNPCGNRSPGVFDTRGSVPTRMTNISAYLMRVPVGNLPFYHVWQPCESQALKAIRGLHSSSRLPYETCWRKVDKWDPKTLKFAWDWWGNFSGGGVNHGELVCQAGLEDFFVRSGKICFFRGIFYVY